MSIANMQDVLYLVGAICLAWITVFLCWVLYEAGRLVHQANELVTDTREKINMVERVLMSIGEKLSNASQYLGLIADGGRQILSIFRSRSTPTKTSLNKKVKKAKKILDDVEEDVENTEDWEN